MRMHRSVYLSLHFRLLLTIFEQNQQGTKPFTFIKETIKDMKGVKVTWPTVAHYRLYKEPHFRLGTKVLKC